MLPAHATFMAVHAFLIKEHISVQLTKCFCVQGYVAINITWIISIYAMIHFGGSTPSSGLPETHRHRAVAMESDMYDSHTPKITHVENINNEMTNRLRAFKYRYLKKQLLTADMQCFFAS